MSLAQGKSAVQNAHDKVWLCEQKKLVHAVLLISLTKLGFLALVSPADEEKLIQYLQS